MSLSIERVGAPDAGTWDGVWSHCDYATFFHSRHWLEVWKHYTGEGRDDVSRLIRFSDGARAVVTLSSRRRAAGLVTGLESGPRGTYGGWISDGDLGPGHSGLLVDYMTGLGDIAWFTNPFDPNAAVIHDAGGEPDVTDAMTFDGDFDAVFRTWSKGHRAAVRQAQRNGVTIREADGAGDWRAYYGAYEDSLQRWGNAASRPYRWEMFERISRLPRELVRLWLAEIGGAVVAGAVCFYAPRHVVYWHGAAYAEHFKKRPVNLLVHAASRDACERGYRWFDFNPSGGLEGVRSFKTSFGTTAYPCPTIRRRKPLTKLLDRLARK